MNITIKNKIRFLALLLFSFLPAASFAADLFNPSSGDISIKTLGAIFGGLLSGGGKDPLLSSIAAFNGGVLILGGVLAAYTILAGTLGTAHDGEMLGKGFSSMWLPIRYGVGTALVLPTIGGGYCLMQAIVMWLVVQGIGLADNVWYSYIKNDTTSMANTTASAQTKDTMQTIAESIFNSAVCYQAYAKAVADANKALPDLNYSKYQFTMQKADGGYVFGDSSGNAPIAACGAVQYPKPLIQQSAAQPNTNPGVLGDLSSSFAPLDVSSVNSAQQSATDTLVQTINGIATNAVNQAAGTGITAAQAGAYKTQVNQAVTAYETAMTNAASTLSTNDAFQGVIAAANNQGWMLAGTWFTRIIQMNEQIHAAANSTPGTAAATWPLGINDIDIDAQKYLNAAIYVMQVDISGVSNGKVTGKVDDVQSCSWNPMSHGSCYSISALTAKVKAGYADYENQIFQAFSGINPYTYANDPRHPLIVLQEYGNSILSLTFNAIAIYATVPAVLSIIPGLGQAAEIIYQATNWFLSVPMYALLASGVTAAYFLPQMPFLLWFGAMVGWVLLVIEAVIAAPMWAVMHLHPHGNDLTGKAANGYNLMLSLLLRPVLMIFGFMASLVISYVLGEFLNKVYFLEFAQSTQNITGWWSFFSIAFGSLFYVIMVFVFIRKCFSLTFQIPDQLLTWFGGQGQSLGNFAGDFSSGLDTGTKVAAGASAYFGSAGKTIGKTVGGSIGATASGLKGGARGAVQGFKDGADGGISGALTGAAKGALKSIAGGAKQGAAIYSRGGQGGNKSNSYSAVKERVAAEQKKDSNEGTATNTPAGGNAPAPNNPEPQEEE